MAITTRALVLGGGGLAGIAWEVGVLVGLAEAGVDVGAAERIVGTSAGSVVGALVATGVDLAEVHAEHLAVDAATAGPTPTLDLEEMGRAFAAAMRDATGEQDMRARLGAWARSVEGDEQERLDIIAARLPVHAWPDRDLRVTAVDTASGESVAFDRDRGVDLVHAVAASCAVPGVWPPVTIGDRRYMDGGMASIVHVPRADAPAPADTVLVIAPLDPPAGGPFASVGAEVGARRAAHPAGSITMITADGESLQAFGANVLDAASMPGSARAGREQGLRAGGFAW